jgi:hypothetical protein
MDVCLMLVLLPVSDKQHELTYVGGAIPHLAPAIPLV